MREASVTRELLFETNSQAFVLRVLGDINWDTYVSAIEHAPFNADPPLLALNLNLP